MVVVPPAHRVTTAMPRLRRWNAVAIRSVIYRWALCSGLLWIFASLVSGCSRAPKPSVVVYCAQDQVFAEPILADFARETGILVRPVFDSEAVKTVGLANRLLAERDSPQCDVWWGNEEFRIRQLAARGVLADSNAVWTFGRRTRRMVIHTGRVGPAANTTTGMVQAPESLLDLTNAVWRGRVSIAYPLFGSTATHLLVLRQRWGESNWLAWCRALAANRPFIEEGNSHVVRRVAAGEAWIGLTDSDDIASGRRNGQPVAALDPGLMPLPNTVALVRPAAPGSPAVRLAEFLRSPEVRARLVSAGALEATEVRESTTEKSPDWADLLNDLEAATQSLQRIFRR
jgi:iron(III) transport system substrate-binding protein